MYSKYWQGRGNFWCQALIEYKLLVVLKEDRESHFLHFGGIIVELIHPYACAESGGNEISGAPSGIIPGGVSHSFELVRHLVPCVFL